MDIACVLLFVLVVLDVTAGQECGCPGGCPDGWTQFRGSCYYLYENETHHWTEAANYCLTRESSLVSIESLEEDMFIRTAIKRIYRNIAQSGGQEFWIGATDDVIEAVWVWYNGDRPLTYSDWYPGQPGSDGQDEDCAVIAASTAFIGWHDAPCSALHHPICEINMQPQSPTNEIIG